MGPTFLLATLEAEQITCVAVTATSVISPSTLDTVTVLLIEHHF
jgi:hypothetical protein